MIYTQSFIDGTLVTDLTDISKNFSSTNLRLYILGAQEEYIYPILGKQLYDRFDTDMRASGDAKYGSSAYQTSHAAYYTLMQDFVQPALVQAAYLLAIRARGIQLFNNGLGGLTTAQFAGASSNDINFKIERAEEKLALRLFRLKEFLNENENDYSELNEDVDLRSDEPDLILEKSNRTVFFKNRRRKY